MLKEKAKLQAAKQEVDKQLRIARQDCERKLFCKMETTLITFH